MGKKENNVQTTYLVFYLDREMMMNSELIDTFAESVNEALSQRKANAMAFFIPTDGPERIDCLNPVQVGEADMEKINKLVSDLQDNFDVGKTIDTDLDDINVKESE